MGSSKPTIIDVAALAGVSKSVVSRVLRRETNVSDESRALVLAAARQLGYRPNLAARSLVQQRTELIGFLVSDFSSFVSELIDGAEIAAGAAGYRVICCTGGREPRRELAALDTLLELRMDGILMGSPQLDDLELAYVADAVPCVMVGRPVEGAGMDSITNDDAVGAGLVVDHLVELGHTRIAHARGGRHGGPGMRGAGFVAAMRGHGLEPLVVDAGLNESDGMAAAPRVLGLTPRPTAVFAGNDMCAVGMKQAMEESGLRIPEDISLVGYDNVRLSGLRQVALTTVNQPRGGMGRRAVELLVDRIRAPRDPHHVLLDPHLVVRSTSGPPPPR